MNTTEAVSLMYHDFEGRPQGEPYPAPCDLESRYVMPFDKFESQIKALSQLLRLKQDAIPVLVTFDDGKESITDAAAILERYGFRGYFFIIADRIGEPGYAGREQIISLRKRGHIIGTHSLTHPRKISQLQYKDILYEWQESSRVLGSILGERIRTAAVPGGFCSKNVIKAAREAGISTLFNSEPVVSIRKYDDIMVAGRFNINSSDKDSVVTGLASSRGFERQKKFLCWNVKKLIKKALGRHFAGIKQLLTGSGR